MEDTVEQSNSLEPLYPIGVVAKMLDVSEHTIRLYEREGLILTWKTTAGHRRFSDNDVEKLKCIRRMITEKGLNLEGIKRLCSMIPCWGIKKDCTREKYENCEAFEQVGLPCWALENKPDICRSDQCYTCQVYQTYFDCKNIKELVHSKTYLRKLFQNSASS
ncbi:MAG: MerR family transcriptional regulator [Candidatus Marinimicrobia bacterium]|nr:MerR family transcriptional regulator [Candidatus Neomarinimicrobiota bacterium]MCF7828474.1 MerR family transcriptional regulator [Candidatus Neomarinimicrobiota bacterium]MCF7881964.1 MerR family transcriptional regulator [Candidatus Neomarinimicrobiota bacterium]